MRKLCKQEVFFSITSKNTSTIIAPEYYVGRGDCTSILHSGTSCFRIVNPYITIRFFALVSYTYDVEFKWSIVY